MLYMHMHNDNNNNNNNNNIIVKKSSHDEFDVTGVVHSHMHHMNIEVWPVGPTHVQHGTLARVCSCLHSRLT